MQVKRTNAARTLSVLVREYRAATKQPLRKLAAKCGLSAGYIQDIELGRRLASNEAVTAIATALDADPAEFLDAVARERIAKLRALIRQEKELTR